MKIETLGDVLQWTREFHVHLSTSMFRCADQHESERARLLLDYLVKHEEKLSRSLDEFQKFSSYGVLATWCIEYINKQPIIAHPYCNESFVSLSSEQIMEVIVNYHQQIIELYRYLAIRNPIPKAQELLESLLFFEEQEIMLMSQAANRLEDL